MPGDQRHAAARSARAGRSPRRGSSTTRPTTASISKAAGCSCSGSNLPLLPIFNISRGTGGATGWLVPDISFSTRKGLELALALPLAARAQSRPRRLRRTFTPAFCPRSKSNIASSTASARSRSAASSPTGRSKTSIPTPRPTPQGASRLCRGQRQVPARSRMEHHHLAPRRERQDRHPALRHHQRRPPAQRRQRRADQPQFLHFHCRLGVPGPARRRSCRSKSRSRFRRSTRASGSTTSPAARSSLQANSLAIIRIEGQDTQRAFASARWDLRRLTPWGQELVLTAYGRGDVYHTDDAESTPVADLPGTDGWHARRSERLPPTSNGRSLDRCSAAFSASSRESRWC